MTKVKIRFGYSRYLDYFIKKLQPYIYYLDKVKYSCDSLKDLPYQFSFEITYEPIVLGDMSEQEIIYQALRETINFYDGIPYELKMKTKKNKKGK